MTRSALCLLPLAIACAAHAQTSNPVIAEQKNFYNGVKNNLLKAAEKMPDDAYTFKATPELQTWAERTAHVAQAAMGTCARVKGEQKQADLGTKSKADINAALKAAFDECDAAWDSITDANANEMLSGGRGPQTSKLGALIRNTAHIDEVYGTMTVYMRLKGVVPPSSEGRGGR